MSGQLVWLIRHGETEWSRDGRHTGRTDVQLTAAGEAAAQALRPALAGREFRLVLTSPLQRARRTCELSGLGGDATLDPDLMEWDYGAYEGRTTAAIRTERPGWTVWRDGVPGGETATQVAARCDRVVERLRASEGDAAVFAHGHLLRALAARWLGQPVADGRLYALSTAALCILGYERETPVLLRWNDPAAALVHSP